jgi:hypothetical protein
MPVIASSNLCRTDIRDCVTIEINDRTVHAWFKSRMVVNTMRVLHKIVPET